MIHNLKHTTSLIINVLLFLALITSCNENKLNKENNQPNQTIENKKAKTIKEEPKEDVINSDVENNYGLIDVKSLNQHLFVDLKYTTEDNFMHQILYKKIKKAYLQKEVAIRLSKCQDYLSTIDTNLHLLIYDALRPLSVQQEMWDALDTIPVNERTKFVSNPKNGSIHNYGAAIDITICNYKGEPLDMGANYDDIREIAYPKFEERFLESGELKLEQINNRKLLRKVMRSQSFSNITTEWWHFNACSRNEAKQRYQLVEKE
jgi:zinc D-Ala-D-Ala dipeptidase